MADHLKFDLLDDVSVTELRGEDWPGRLTRAGKLRVQRRGEVMGVLLSVAEWHRLSAAIEAYERQLEELEDERDRQLVAERAGAPLERGTSLSGGIDRELRDTGLL